MPYKPKTMCNKPGCRNLVDKGYCPFHEKQRSREYEKSRPNARQRGYALPRWRKTRASHLKDYPRCEICAGSATEVDHVIAARGPHDPLFWDMHNLRSLCKWCHSKKTAKKDGRWGTGKH
jgi:5-methylcytosine-specific restriction protein A